MSFWEWFKGLDKVTLILGIVLLVISILFLCGKGFSLMAGWNTASEKEKAQYDEKKLGLVMGSILMAFAVATLALSVFLSVVWYIFAYTAFIIGGTILLFWLVNSYCKK